MVSLESPRYKDSVNGKEHRLDISPISGNRRRIDGASLNDSQDGASQHYYYNSEPNKYRNTYQKSGDSPSEEEFFYTYEQQQNGRKQWTPTERTPGKSGGIPQLKRTPSQRKTSTPKKGDIVRATSGSPTQNKETHGNNSKKNTLKTSSKDKSSSSFDKKLSNTVALPIVPVKKRTDETFENKLSNPLATTETKQTTSETTTQTSTSHTVQKKRTDLNRRKSSSDSDESEKPSNIDKNGENAKLLSVRRIDTPDRKQPGDSANSSSSSIPDNSDAPDVFLPKRYILAIMMFMGFVNLYAVRVNLNVAIGAMVNNHTVVKDGVAITVVSSFWKLSKKSFEFENGIL